MNKRLEPHYSMAAKLPTIDKRFAPSPNTYNITQFNCGATGSKWCFGSEKRRGIGKGTLSPGPGAYSHTPQAFAYEKGKFYIGEKIMDLKPTTRVPGSGTYESNN